jgi:hypothetical protein
MFKILIIGFLIVAFNVVLQAAASMYWLDKTKATLNKWQNNVTHLRMFRILIFSFLYLTFLHLIHAFVWAVSIDLLPKTGVDFSTFGDTFYYSVVTFTTLGYGDMTISSEWRMLSGFEAINGIMLIGWSTALMYSLIQGLYRYTNKGSDA